MTMTVQQDEELELKALWRQQMFNRVKYLSDKKKIEAAKKSPSKREEDFERFDRSQKSTDKKRWSL